MEKVFNQAVTDYDFAVGQAIEITAQSARHNSEATPHSYEGVSSLEIGPPPHTPEVGNSKERRLKKDVLKKVARGALIAALVIPPSIWFAEAIVNHAEAVSEKSEEFKRQSELAEWQLQNGYAEIDTPDMDPNQPKLD